MADLQKAVATNVSANFPVESVSLKKEKREAERLTSDRVMQELMNLLGIAEVDARIVWPEKFYDALCTLGKEGFGKPSNFWALAVALVSGQAPMIPVSPENRELGLQVMLGLGGPKVVKLLRQGLEALNNGNSEGISKFWQNWEGRQYNQAFIEQLGLAKQGHGLVTQMAADVGALRNLTQELARQWAPELALPLDGDWMISTVNVPVGFSTAISGSTPMVLGMSPEAVTLRAAVKNPLFITEAILKILKQDRTFVSLLKEAYSALTSDKQRQKLANYRLDENCLNDVRTWLDKMGDVRAIENPVESAVLDSQRELTLPVLLSQLGNNALEKRKSMEYARVFAALAVTILNQQTLHYQNYKAQIPQMMQFVAGDKLRLFINNAQDLAKLVLAKQQNLGGVLA